MEKYGYTAIFAYIVFVKYKIETDRAFEKFGLGLSRSLTPRKHKTERSLLDLSSGQDCTRIPCDYIINQEKTK